jgi:hypothetical protein
VAPLKPKGDLAEMMVAADLLRRGHRVAFPHGEDWLAIYDVTTGRCYYVPSAELGDGRRAISLRLVPASSGRRADIHDAADYLWI